MAVSPVRQRPPLDRAPMKCLAVCQDELVIRTLHQVLVPGFDIEFLVESRPLARKLHDAGLEATLGDPRRVDTYLKADVSPNTLVLVQDNGRRSLRRMSSKNPADSQLIP